MGKAPAIQFYVRDWLSDPQLRLASPSTRGIWIDLLCFMWDAPNRGTIRAEYNQLNRMVSANNGDLDRFIEEATDLKFCDISVTENVTVTEKNKIITIINRRMLRDTIDKDNNRLRQARYRERQKDNEKITPPSSSSSSTTLHITDCPQQKIVDLWGEVLPELPQPKVWKGTREINLRSRWKEDTNRQSLEWWQKFFNYIRESKFLMGKVSPSASHAQFMARLDWVVKSDNFEKIREGVYHR